MAIAELWETAKHAIAAYIGLSPATFFTVLAHAFAFYHLVSGFFAAPPPPRRIDRDFEPSEPLPPPVQLGEIGEEELAVYDGADLKKPLLMAIKGHIYDVTQSRPNGREFVTCKEVASYMVSLVGHQDVKQQTSCQDENDSPDLVKSTPECAAGSSQGDVMKDKPDYLAVMPISSPSADQEKPSAFFSVVECHKCSLTFGDKETHVQHLLSFHQNDSKRKRRRLGTSIRHGVIVKDGKYICQFCYKSFSERRRYNGHVGSHVRNPGSNIDFIPEQIEDGPSGVGQEHENITKHEDLRMDVETPMEFDLISQHEMSYVAQMEDVNDPLLELDWHLSLLDDGCEFKQCVWRGREFYHDSLSSQLRPNMIGLICPACKENT